MEDNSGFLTLLMTFVGPIVLGLAILYLILRTRGVSWRQRQHTERATQENYARTDETRQRAEASDRRDL